MRPDVYKRQVLVPELLNGLPFRFFATSSIDALIHAVESSLSPKGNEMTRMFGYKAIDMILHGYKKIAADGPEARMPLLEDFLMASLYAVSYTHLSRRRGPPWS